MAQFLVGLVNIFGGRWEAKSREVKETAFIPVSTEAMAEHQRMSNSRPSPYGTRYSADSGQGTERNTESLRSHSSSSSLEHNQFNSSDLRREYEEANLPEKQVAQKRSRIEEYLSKKLSGLSHFRVLNVFDILYKVVDRVILILAFTAYATGLITYAGIFVSLLDLVTSRC